MIQSCAFLLVASCFLLTFVVTIDAAAIRAHSNDGEILSSKDKKENLKLHKENVINNGNRSTPPDKEGVNFLDGRAPDGRIADGGDAGKKLTLSPLKDEGGKKLVGTRKPIGKDSKDLKRLSLESIDGVNGDGAADGEIVNEKKGEVQSPAQRKGFPDNAVIQAPVSVQLPQGLKAIQVNDSLRFLASIVPLKMEEFQPPDHLEGVRMEQDGHINKDYKKEILLGNHEEFEWTNENKLLGRLKVIFNKADKNHDGYLQQSELQGWIMLKVREHLNEAIEDNKKVFKHLDANKDGFITWKEFHVHFLLAKGYSFDKAKEHADDSEGLALDPEEKERIIRYKFRWAEADEEPQDNRLTFEEMKNFRHPEQSSVMILRMAKDIIDNLDRNEDNIITEEEFVALPLGEVDRAGMEMDLAWQEERRKEFKEIIDLNKDGKVDLEELKNYVDPHNSNHAKLEAENLIKLADDNGDEKLSIQEVLDNAELFLGSKMVDTSRNFHDEF